MSKIKLMSHLVAGYPTNEISLAAARALVAGGADILEIQLPFSDPSADGPAIQTACTKVLERNFRTQDGLDYIAQIHKEFPDVTIYLMSYGSLIYTPGVDAFCRKAAACGVTGMIIPDLPFDCDEGLTKACKENGMENIKKPIKITETILRDAHQSLIATRMTTEQMLPIVEKMDKVGYHSVECWGGATFDASLRFLKEDPWERLRKFRDGFKNTKLQMLFRGQNILGYRPYADDVVEYFVQKSVANGMDIIRIFDCLNDMRNLETAVKSAVKEGADAQVALSYTLGDAYTMEYWMDIAKRIEEMGATSICIKDMAGLLVPYKATDLVSALKEATDLPIQLHP